VPWGKQRSVSGMVYLFCEESKQVCQYAGPKDRWHRSAATVAGWQALQSSLCSRGTKVERLSSTSTTDDVLFIAHLRRQQEHAGGRDLDADKAISDLTGWFVPL
jgi:hypothetical protein